MSNTRCPLGMPTLYITKHPVEQRRASYLTGCASLAEVFWIFSASNIDLEIWPWPIDPMEAGERKIELVLQVVNVPWVGCRNVAGKSQRVVSTQDVVQVAEAGASSTEDWTTTMSGRRPSRVNSIVVYRTSLAS